MSWKAENDMKKERKKEKLKWQLLDWGQTTTGSEMAHVVSKTENDDEDGDQSDSLTSIDTKKKWNIR